MKQYIGIADDEGLIHLSKKPSKSDALTAAYYEKADNWSNGCYFEIGLTESQADIIRSLGETGDCKAGLAACIAYGNISVPEDHKEIWEIISSGK